MARYASLRASDADRDAVAERLREATIEGRLEPYELEERLDVALRARTYGDLRRLLVDLPGKPVRRVALVPAAGIAFAIALRLAFVLAIVTAVIVVAASAAVWWFLCALVWLSCRGGRAQWRPPRARRARLH